MVLPNPSRDFPDPDDHPTGIDGDTYGRQIAANGQRLYDMVINQVTGVGGTVNAITGVCSPALTAYAHGQTFRFTPAGANTTAVTLNFGPGPAALKDYTGAALASGALAAVPTECWWDNDNGFFRLSQLTLAQASAALLASAQAATLWEVVGDTTIGSAVANVEHTFTIGRYVALKSFINNMTNTGGVGAPYRFALRNSTTALLTLPTFAPGNPSVQAGFRIDWFIDVTSSGKCLYGEYMPLDSSAPPATPTLVQGFAVPSSAPDRVRYDNSAGNLTNARIMTYGLRKPS